ncbi:MAG TPA: tRNA 4-thiouridine(8) synthase ThiI [bacterium]|nr:tRNA 4-thiouridine(8) synthase ThiI [bacterium]
MIKLLSMKVKAIGMISGGLDSLIAMQLICQQDIDVIPIIFSSVFFHSDIYSKEIIDFMGIKTRIISMEKEYLDIIKHPVYGYGCGMNPCIDCKIYMLKQAKKIMEAEKASFVFTGDVVNQRPFSQTKNFLTLIEKASGLEGRIVRPLCAKLLNPTLPEIEGLVDRKKLLDISGRSRKKQLDIAEKLGIFDYSQPSGGCLLTDGIFAQKIKTLFNNWPGCNLDDVKLIKHGRTLWHKNNLVVIGRNEKENKILFSIAKPNDIIIEIKNIPCPLCVIRGENITDDVIEYAKNLERKYSPKAKGKIVEFVIGTKNGYKTCSDRP